MGRGIKKATILPCIQQPKLYCFHIGRCIQNAVLNKLEQAKG